MNPEADETTEKNGISHNGKNDDMVPPIEEQAHLEEKEYLVDEADPIGICEQDLVEETSIVDTEHEDAINVEEVEEMKTEVKEEVKVEDVEEMEVEEVEETEVQEVEEVEIEEVRRDHHALDASHKADTITQDSSLRANDTNLDTVSSKKRDTGRQRLVIRHQR